MEYFIITGTSGGLGEALARSFSKADRTIFCLSRNPNPSLMKYALESGAAIEFIKTDLSKIDFLEEKVEYISKKINPGIAKGIYLINNAGILSPLGPIEQGSAEAFSESALVNLAAPLALSALFISAFQDYSGIKRIMNISSGAAQSPYEGWASYCATKAALEMATRVIAMEQQRKKNPVTIFCVAPGVLETRMQEAIRNSSPEKFPMHQKFVALKENNQLQSPQEAAQKLNNLLLSQPIDNGALLDIRQLAL